MKILIRNLDRETTEQELQTAFEAHGKVQSSVIVREHSNGLSNGFGFIEMPKACEAKVAVKNRKDSMLGANKIRVKYAEDKAETQAKPKED